MTIRPARLDEAAELSRLALRSKAMWGYDEAFLEACRAELTVAPELIRRGRVFVLELGGRLVGVASLEDLADSGVELGLLFVEPELVGRGLGRRLLEHAAHKARDLGFDQLVIQGDPNAGDFYQRCGARLIGERPSASVAGRSLPLFELDLTAPGDGH